MYVCVAESAFGSILFQVIISLQFLSCTVQNCTYIRNTATMTYEYILILTRYLAKMETRAQTPGWSRTGCWSRNKRRLSLALRQPITAQTLPPFNYTVMPSVQCRRKRSFWPSRWQKKKQKTNPIAMQSHGSLRGVPPESSDPAAAETILHSLLIFYMAGKHGAAATAGAARI